MVCKPPKPVRLGGLRFMRGNMRGDPDPAPKLLAIIGMFPFMKMRTSSEVRVSHRIPGRGRGARFRCMRFTHAVHSGELIQNAGTGILLAKMWISAYRSQNAFPWINENIPASNFACQTRSVKGKEVKARSEPLWRRYGK